MTLRILACLCVCTDVPLTMTCLTLLGCLMAPNLIALHLTLMCLPLQAYPLQHATFDLSRLPAASLPTFGSALPFNMVSSSIWATVRVGAHQLTTHAIAFSCSCQATLGASHECGVRSSPADELVLPCNADTEAAYEELAVGSGADVHLQPLSAASNEVPELVSLHS